MNVLVIHGPNLQLLGHRNPAVYGHADLDSINRDLRQTASREGAVLTIVQSNHEGQIVEFIGKAKGRYDGLLINAAAYTHTSVAIRDAIEASAVPAVEVHLSNIYAREPFRQHSLIAPVCQGQVTGFGALSYRLGLEALVAVVQRTRVPVAPMTDGRTPQRAKPARAAARRATARRRSKR